MLQILPYIWGLIADVRTNQAEAITNAKLNQTSDAVLELAGIVEDGQLFRHDAATTSGLTFGLSAGRTRKSDGTVVQKTASTIALTASATNYVEIDADGNATASAARTLAKKPAYKVTTDTGSITAIEDERVSFDFS
jgi:hypothetical protein